MKIIRVTGSIGNDGSAVELNSVSSEADMDKPFNQVVIQAEEIRALKQMGDMLATDQVKATYGDMLPEYMIANIPMIRRMDEHGLIYGDHPESALSNVYGITDLGHLILSLVFGQVSIRIELPQIG